MKIVLFHYHLDSGGVTDVIALSTRILLELRPDIEEIRLVTSVEAGAVSTLDRIRKDLDQTAADKLKLDILPEIGYVKDLGPDPEFIRTRLESRYGEDDLWWIHNYHLGKNPAFTAALTAIAREGRQRMIFHIHDFPESGRFENLSRLDEVLEEPPYPSGPHLRYVVINERDRRLLADAGLGEAVHLLNNPVSLGPLPEPDPEGVGEALEKFPEAFPSFKPGSPILFYPVRSIRRKNILEAGLFVKMLEEPANLLVSLPGVSVQEKPYSDLVAGAFSKGLISGAWNTAASSDPRLSYLSLAVGCDGVISTSVQEGFGYLYLNSLHWRKPLLARYLDVMNSLLDIFGDYPRRFWADLRIPPWKGLIDGTVAAYRKNFQKLKGLLPPRIIAALEVVIAKPALSGGLDMSFLAPADQMKALHLAGKDPGWFSELCSGNKELLHSAGKTLAARPPDMERRIKGRFGPEPFARSFDKILRSFGRDVPTPSPKKIREALFKAFGRLDYFRLLYD